MQRDRFDVRVYKLLAGSAKARHNGALPEEPFFSALSRHIRKVPTNAVPTAGVRINPTSGNFELFYNPEFMDSLDDFEFAAVYKHELYHIIFQHVLNRLPEEGLTKKWNVATDLAINSLLTGLPEGCLIPGQPGTPWEHMPMGQTSEWYMANLPAIDEDPCGGGGQGDHSAWGDDKLPSHVRDMAEDKIKSKLKKIDSDLASGGQSWGSVPIEIQRELQKSLQPKLDWKSILRYFIKTSQRSSRRSSMKRLNRRYPYVHPGRKAERTAKIAISIDQSGSVGDAMLVAFFTELNKLASLAEFTVVPFDCTVAEDHIYVWKKGERRVWERVRYGGTCFNGPTKWVNDNGFDGHIVLTDLCAPKPIASKCQRMWMTTSHYAKRPYFQTDERIIAIDEG